MFYVKYYHQVVLYNYLQQDVKKEVAWVVVFKKGLVCHEGSPSVGVLLCPPTVWV